MSRIVGSWRLFAILNLFFLASSASTHAQTTINVPANAPSIQAGIDAANNGDTVLVAPGTYNENIDFKGKAITVTSGASDRSAATATIINGTNDGPVVTFSTNEPSTTSLNGFTIQNGHASRASGKNGGGIYISGASPLITNNIVTGNLGCGIAVFNGGGPVVRGNTISQNSAAGDGGSRCFGPNSQGGEPGAGITLIEAGTTVVDNNLIEENTCIASSMVSCGTTGIFLFNGGQISITGNTIRNNYSSDAAGILAYPSTQLFLIQNLIYSNGGQQGSFFEQVYLWGAQRAPFPSLIEINNSVAGGGETIVWSFDPSSRIQNNIFLNTTNVPSAGGGSAGLSCGDSEAVNSGIQISNNDIYNPINSTSGGCILGNNNQSVDPQFVDSGSQDFHLKPTSPLFTAGDINAPMIPPADLDAKTRTVCNTIDMGVYERRPSPPIALTSSANPTPGGNPLTFTAALTGNCNVPTGTITFFDGTVPIGTATLNGAAIATLTTSFLVVGQHNITAQYSGDFNFDQSTSAILVQKVTGDPTTTSLSVSPNPASAFSSITLQSLVTSAYGTPTGSVVFTASGTTLATAPLDATGKAVATISSLGAGTYTVTATYTADTRFQPSTSPSVQEVVTAASSVTTLAASPNPAAVGQTVTFTTTVRPPQGGTNVPTGTVTLLDGSTTIGTATLSASGAAVFNISSLAFGSHTITAQYGSSANFNTSSATLVESVTLVGTTLTLTASPNPSDIGQGVTLTATSASALSGMTPSGSVTFTDGTAVLGVVPLNGNGVARLTTTTLSVGSHSLQATMAANTAFAGSSSNIVTEVVQSYDFAVMSSANSMSLPPGAWSQITLTVTPIGGFNGPVRLTCNGAPANSLCAFPKGNTVSLAAGAKSLPVILNTSDLLEYGTEIGSHEQPLHGRGSRKALLATVFLPLLSLAGFGRKKPDKWRVWRLGAIICMLSLLFGIEGCSGKLPDTAAPGTYTLVVNAASTDGSIQHSTSLQLIVH